MAPYHTTRCKLFITIGVYTVTYTAPADLAGNVPAAITRTVTIADTTAPSKLNLTASSDNSNADRARAGDTITVTLVADMDIASASAIILNKTANVTISDNIVSSTIVVLAGDSGNTTFTTIVQDPSRQLADSNTNGSKFRKCVC